ncbi:MAG: RT0821/Lpp0805 family surface protein, partial [Pseudomonadota bacterium]
MGLRRNNPASRIKALALVVCALTGAGCTSMSVPFEALGDKDVGQTAIITGSVDSTNGVPSTDSTLPPSLEAESAAAFTRPDADRGAPPTEELIATLEANEAQSSSLTQSDLDAMNGALTRAFRRDLHPGTFAWSNPQTGAAGVMTPFRAASSVGPDCRIVSV